MTFLAIDTCLGACSAAVLSGHRLRGDSAITGGDVLARRCELMQIGHAERLMPMVREVMAEAGVAFHDLAFIAVTTGPGTFTGVRIGIAAARGLALAASLPVRGATSLALIAADVARQSPTVAGRSRIVVAVDARHAQVFVQEFDAAGEQALSLPALLGVSEAIARCAGDPGVVLAGSGAPAIGEAAAAAGVSALVCGRDLQPDATLFGRVPLAALEPPLPVYLRPPDAKPQIGKSLPRAAG